MPVGQVAFRVGRKIQKWRVVGHQEYENPKEKKKRTRHVRPSCLLHCLFHLPPQSGNAIREGNHNETRSLHFGSEEKENKEERKKLGRRRNLLTTQDTRQQGTPHRATSNAQPVFFLTSSTVEPSMSSISLRPLPFSTSNTHYTKRKKESKQARKKEIENDLPLDLKGEE